MVVSQDAEKMHGSRSVVESAAPTHNHALVQIKAMLVDNGYKGVIGTGIH
jgi:hypothetical protein